MGIPKPCVNVPRQLIAIPQGQFGLTPYRAPDKVKAVSGNTVGTAMRDRMSKMIQTVVVVSCRQRVRKYTFL